MEETFGQKVSTEFIIANLSNIKEMAEGDVEALKKLRSALVEDFIKGLDISTNGAKSALSKMMAELQQQADKNPQVEKFILITKKLQLPLMKHYILVKLQ